MLASILPCVHYSLKSRVSKMPCFFGNNFKFQTKFRNFLIHALNLWKKYYKITCLHALKFHSSFYYSRYERYENENENRADHQTTIEL